MFGEYFSTDVNLLRRAYKTIGTWKLPRYYKLRTNEALEFKYVSIIFFKKQWKSLKRKKSSRLDYLPQGLLKDCAEEIAARLHHLINLFLNSSMVSVIEKETRIIPLFKSGDKHNPSNYRPVSLLPVLSKLLERSLHPQLIEYLESNNLLSANQFGYWKNQSRE